MGLLSNISPSRYQRIIEAFGWCYDHKKGGHVMFSKKGYLRQVVFQTHIDPVPSMVVSKNLKTMNITRKEFEEMASKIK